ncbi:TPA: DEAD/DEAH box helicase [Pseudomonas aeruginosa]
MKELTIRRLLNTPFKDLYLEFVRGGELSDVQQVKLLAVAVLLLNQSAVELKRLGYRIILLYGNRTGHYDALYDVAINSGLMPVSAVINAQRVGKERLAESFILNYADSYIETFRRNDVVMTEQQDLLQDFIHEKYDESVVVVAPTSYGKSELIISSVKDNPLSVVCVIVPSKALLAQTKKRLVDADIDGVGKVITHPEMYAEGKSSRVFVLTQERLTRLLSEHESLSFDMVFVDEAHNLLNGDYRNELLASVICMVGARNRKATFKFLTPFICEELNLRVRYLRTGLAGFRIDEYVKSELFYMCDYRVDKGDEILRLYDHFLNEWVDLKKSYKNSFDLVLGESLSKNIIYGNKPKNIEIFAWALAQKLPLVKCPIIKKACDELADNFDSQYLIIDCLRRGVMYHHGSIADTVRLYLESMFSKSKDLKYLVCSATLLEGVNLPIERLFLIDHRKGGSNLTSSQFKNLVGRVNRFSEVFSKKGSESLKRLESSVYLVGMDGYTTKNADLFGYYERVVNVSKSDKDDPENILLEATDIVEGVNSDRYEDVIERLENLQPGIVDDFECKYIKTEVGRLILANGIGEIDVFSVEELIDLELKSFVSEHGVIHSSDKLMLAVKQCFIDHFDELRGYSDLSRLEEESARAFYAMMLDWKIKKYTMKQIISQFLKHWDERAEKNASTLEFVGKWGDRRFGESYNEHWVAMSEKTQKEKINLAIVRIKEEDDFFDYKIFRFVEVMNGVGVIDSDFYKKIKYGTTDDVKIKMIRDGYSRGLSDLILNKYSNKVKLSADGEVDIDPKLVGEMMMNDESDLMLFEAQMNLKYV